MSVFISFNFETGHLLAQAVGDRLRAQGLDAWWLDKPIPPDLLDPIIAIALSNCSRCIVLLTRPEMSNWQVAEIVTIRQVFTSKLPAGMARECFLFLRATDLSPVTPQLPLFRGSEHLEFLSKNVDRLDFGFLGTMPPAFVPLTCGHHQAPRILRDPDFSPVRGQHLVHGDFVPYDGPARERYCWVLLRDTGDNYYIQQPRPTLTHARRWAAPNIVLGSNIREILLAAVEETEHRTIVERVLNQDFGALRDRKLIRRLDILDKLTFKRTK